MGDCFYQIGPDDLCICLYTWDCVCVLFNTLKAAVIKDVLEEILIRRV